MLNYTFQSQWYTNKKKLRIILPALYFPNEVTFFFFFFFWGGGGNPAPECVYGQRYEQRFF